MGKIVHEKAGLARPATAEHHLMLRRGNPLEVASDVDVYWRAIPPDAEAVPDEID
jgi:hypothetical protein